jgi:hypothetical protein
VDSKSVDKSCGYVIAISASKIVQGGVLFLLPGRNAAQPKLILADDSVIRSQIMTKDPDLSTRPARYPPRAIIVCR